MPTMGAFKKFLKKGTTALDVFNWLSSRGDPVKNDPDERWSNLYRERQKNQLYKWIDVNKGGELLEIYDKEGEEGVIAFANEKIAPLLYNDGTIMERITLSDYTKWKKTLDSSLSGGFLNDSDNSEPIAKFIPHMAQWRLNKRGVDGETVIHLLLSRDDAKSTEIVKLLVKLFPGLAVDMCEGDEFYGQSALHLAIVHDDYDCVCTLVEAGVDVKCRATGRFFLPEDQKKETNPKETNYHGFAYYGEYPLAFAATFGNKDIFDFLIQNDADPNAQDSFGNTVLHICVINNSIEMYSYAVRHWAKPADVNICNYAGYTPLTLATILGRRQIFDAMLELTKVEFWRFSDMACSAYPLATLDTIRSDGSTNWDSALMRVVTGTSDDHLEIVGSDVIQRLLADKWKAFGRRKMYQRLILLILHLLVLSTAVYIRPRNTDHLWGRHSGVDIFRYLVELAVLVSCCSFLFIQQGSELKAQGVPAYLRTLVHAPDKILFLISNILLLMCVPCRLVEQHTLEETLLCLALPGSWIYLLFFAKGYLLTGPFVIMIYTMLTGDMIRFAVISLVFLVSFSQAFFFLGKNMQDRQNARWCSVQYTERAIVDYDAYVETAITLFRMALGGYDYLNFDCASYRTLTKILFVIYMIIMPIMLINMLIAMMGNTYTTIIEQAEEAWRQQWSQMVILLERGIDKKKLAKYQAQYSIKLNDDRFAIDDDGAMEIRALMVIKQTTKTRAKQRKQATASWKRLTRKVMAAVKRQGTEQARETLHSHSNVPAVSRPNTNWSHEHHSAMKATTRAIFPALEGAFGRMSSVADNAPVASPRVVVHRPDVPMSSGQLNEESLSVVQAEIERVDIVPGVSNFALMEQSEQTEPPPSTSALDPKQSANDILRSEHTVIFSSRQPKPTDETANRPTIQQPNLPPPPARKVPRSWAWPNVSQNTPDEKVQAESTEVPLEHGPIQPTVGPSAIPEVGSLAQPNLPASRAAERRTQIGRTLNRVSPNLPPGTGRETQHSRLPNMPLDDLNWSSMEEHPEENVTRKRVSKLGGPN